MGHIRRMCHIQGAGYLRSEWPIRFLIRDPAACRTDELDDCANVKFVDRIELTTSKGHDTRPENEAEHERLHRNQS